jgi:hypothetical protein
MILCTPVAVACSCSYLVKHHFTPKEEGKKERKKERKKRKDI